MMIQGLTPAVTAPQIGQSANAMASSGSSSSSSGSSATNLQGTFLNLLVTELQNQDPTSPVDPTAMVGQMVSLNQLDQLISINQTLQQSLASGTTPTTGETSKPTTASNSTLPSSAASAKGLPVRTAQAAPAQSTVQPAIAGPAENASLMNLYGSLAAPMSPLVSTISGGK